MFASSYFDPPSENLTSEMVGLAATFFNVYIDFTIGCIKNMYINRPLANVLKKKTFSLP